MMITAVAVLLALPIQGTNAGKPKPPQPNAQTPKTSSDEIRDGRMALAKRVAVAHRGDNKTSFDRYKATITISSLGKKTENVDVRLEVSYASKIRPSKDAEPVEMIRYTIAEGDKPLERGKDPMPWQRIGTRVTGLLGRDDAESRQSLESHTRLCKQMLQFLDAGAILAGLRGDEPVKSVTLNLGRSNKIEADFITGRIASFPVVRADDKSVKMGAAFLEAWIDKKTSRLAAVRIYPLPLNGKLQRDHGEFIALGNYKASNGVQIPTELIICQVTGETRTPQVKVTLSAFKLNADLTKSHFARPD